MQRLKLKWLPQPKECTRSPGAVMEWVDILPLVTGYCVMVLTAICLLIAELLLHNYLSMNTTLTSLLHEGKVKSSLPSLQPM